MTRNAERHADSPVLLNLINPGEPGDLSSNLSDFIGDLDGERGDYSSLSGLLIPLLSEKPVDSSLLLV
jgi:hypothetical protein